MGQKVHPRSIRLGVVAGWDSNWYASPKEYALNVKEDHVIRKFLKQKLKAAMVSRIEIDRKAKKLIIRIITGRPGMIVGRGGQGLDQLRKGLVALTGKKEIQLDIIEVAKVDAEAQLISESIAQQLEKRVAFRRAIKQSIQRANRAGVKGIKIMVAGRLGGAEIARTEWAKEGRIPLHTFRADIDYGVAEALTVFGIIGVKVWIFKGEVMPGEKAIPNIKTRSNTGEGDRGNAGGGGDRGLRGAGPGGDRNKGRRGRGGQGGPGGPGGDRNPRRRAGAVTTKIDPTLRGEGNSSDSEES